jgi:hypothetical protein
MRHAGLLHPLTDPVAGQDWLSYPLLSLWILLVYNEPQPCNQAYHQRNAGIAIRMTMYADARTA